MPNRQVKAMFRTALVALVLLVSPSHAQQALTVGVQSAEPGLIQGNKEQPGHLVELWDAIAREAGFTVSYVVMPENRQLLKALDDKKIDVVAGAGRPNDSETKYELSEPFMMSAEALVVPKTDTRPYGDPASLKPLRIATQKGSAYDAYLQGLGVAELVYLETGTELLSSVREGKADAALLSTGIAGYALKSGKFPSLQIAPSYKQTFARPVFMVFRKDAGANLDKTNASLRNLLSKDVPRQIRNKYGID